MIFREDLRYDYPLKSSSVVIDLGCYHGEFAKRISDTYGCHVIGFEPVFHEQAMEASGGKFRVFPFAIGGKAREATITIHDDGTTLYPHESEDHGADTVQVLPFSPAMTLLGIDRIDLIKVNIEGEEYDLLDHIIGWGWIDRIEYLQVQFHDFVADAESRRDRIFAELAKTHDIQWDYPWIWTSWRKKLESPPESP
jgi:FkbM family methyltransferase